jgi:hypothetical protein
VLKGFYTEPNNYLSPHSLEGVNDSLDKDIRFETWELNGDNNKSGVINHGAGSKIYSYKNDRFARLVLGFGIVETQEAVDTSNRATIEIFDTFRELKWMDKPIPIGFLGPRLGNNVAGVRDTHIYYLPVEYFWEPFSVLQMNITNSNTRPWKLIMLTRTV